MHGLQACLFKIHYCCSHIYLSMVKLQRKGEVGGHTLKSHGNYIVDNRNSWNCAFEFLWDGIVNPRDFPRPNFGRILAPFQFKNEQKLPKMVYIISNFLVLYFGENFMKNSVQK